MVRFGCAAMVVVASSVLWASSPAEAALLEGFAPQELAPGLRYASWSSAYANGNRFVAYALVVELDHAAIDVTSGPNEVQRRVATSDFATERDLLAAWNTSFCGGSNRPCGPTISNNVAWSSWDTTHHGNVCGTSLGVGDGRASIYNNQTGEAASWMSDVASTYRQTVDRDAVALLERQGWSNYNPRTAAAVSGDGRRLIILAVDGRSRLTVGATYEKLGQLQLALAAWCDDDDERAGREREDGTWSGINLDGGGSTTLYVRDLGGVVNVPSDGQERTVCAHMGVRLRFDAELASPPPASLVLAPSAQATVAAVWRNTGAASWHPDGPLAMAIESLEPSELRDASWPSDKRVVAMRETAPGETFRAELPLRAPERPGTYTLTVMPVVSAEAPFRTTPYALRQAAWTLEVEVVDDAPTPEPPAPGSGATPSPPAAAVPEPEVDMSVPAPSRPREVEVSGSVCAASALEPGTRTPRGVLLVVVLWACARRRAGMEEHDEIR